MERIDILEDEVRRFNDNDDAANRGIEEKETGKSQSIRDKEIFEYLGEEHRGDV